MPIVLFTGGPEDPGPGDDRQGLTRLLPIAVPGRPYGTFPNRGPRVIIVIDQADLTWTGRTAAVPDKLALAPMDLTWRGLNVPTGQRTHLWPTATPGAHYGAFQPRSPVIAVVLDHMDLTWTGRELAIVGLQLDRGEFLWVGQDLVARDRPAFTHLSPLAGPGRRYTFGQRSEAVEIDEMDLGWEGQSLVIRQGVRLDLTRADLTWTGREMHIPERLDRMDLSWVGQTIGIREGAVTDRMDLTWQGQDVVIQVPIVVECARMPLLWTGRVTIVRGPVTPRRGQRIRRAILRRLA